MQKQYKCFTDILLDLMDQWELLEKKLKKNYQIWLVSDITIKYKVEVILYFLVILSKKKYLQLSKPYSSE